ncbi:hypothetical protein Q8F55_002680 [Vanrija albida]|uniref:Enoyl reductase (ER) domain-containing protein n=1 Tax=Vanrija albida TaxID=181172 RepID=A0ABR3QAH2_9TREE
MAAGSTHSGSTRSVRSSRSERGLSSIFRKAVPSVGSTKDNNSAASTDDDDWSNDDLIFNEYPQPAHTRSPFRRSSSFPTQQRLSTIPASPTSANRAAYAAQAEYEYAPHPGAMSDLWPSLDELTSHHHGRTPNSKKRASTLPTPTNMAPGMSGPSPYDNGAAALAQFQNGQAVPSSPRSTALPSPRQSWVPSPRQSMVPASRQSMVPSPLQSSIVPPPKQQQPEQQQQGAAAFANGSIPSLQSFSTGWDMKASRRAPPPPLRLPVPSEPRRTVSGPAPVVEQRRPNTLHRVVSLPTVCLIPPDDEPSDEPQPKQLSSSIDPETARFSTFSAEWEQTVGDLPETALYDAIIDGKPDAWVSFQSDSPTSVVFPGNASPSTTNASTRAAVASTTPAAPSVPPKHTAASESQSAPVLVQNAPAVAPAPQPVNSVPSVERVAQQPESRQTNTTRDPSSVTSTARNSVIGELDQAFRLGAEPKLQGPPGMSVGETAAVGAATVAAAGATAAAASRKSQQPKPTRPALRNISASETAPASDGKAERKKHRRSLSLSSLFSRNKPNFEELPPPPKIEPQHVKTDKPKTASKRFSMKDLFAASSAQADPSTSKKVRRAQSKPDLRAGKHFADKDAPPVPAIPDGVSNYVPDALAALTKNAGTAPAGTQAPTPSEKTPKKDKRQSHIRSSSLGLGKRMSIGNLFKKSRDQDEAIPSVPSLPEAFAKPAAPGVRPSQSVSDLSATLSKAMPTPSPAPLAAKRATMAAVPKVPGPGVASTMPVAPAATKPISAATAQALANLQKQPNPFPTPTMQMPTPTINKRATVGTVPLSDGSRQRTMSSTGKPYPVQTRIRPPSVDGLLNKAAMSPTSEKPPAVVSVPAAVIERPQTPVKGPLRIVNPSSPSSQGSPVTTEHAFEQTVPPAASTAAPVVAATADKPVLSVDTSTPTADKPTSTVDQNAWITSRPPPKDSNGQSPPKATGKAVVSDLVPPRTSSLPGSPEPSVDDHSTPSVPVSVAGAAAIAAAATAGAAAVATHKSSAQPPSAPATVDSHETHESNASSATAGSLSHMAFAAAFDPPESAFKAPPPNTKRLSSRTVGLGLLGSITNVKSDPTVKQPVIAAYTKEQQLQQEQQQQKDSQKPSGTLTPKRYTPALPSPLSELPPVAEAPVSEEPTLEAPSSTISKAAGGLGRVNRNSTIPAALAATAARKRSESPASPSLISPPLPTGSTIGSPGIVAAATIATATVATTFTGRKASLPPSASSSSLSSSACLPMAPMARVSQDDLTTITMNKTTSPISMKRVSLPAVPGGWPISPPNHASSVDSNGSTSGFFTPMEERSDPFPNPPYAHSNTSSAYLHSAASSRADSPLGLGLDNVGREPPHTEEMVTDSTESTPRAATHNVARPDSGITSAFAGFARREVGTVPLGVSVTRGVGTTAVLHNPVVRHSTPTLLEDAGNRVSAGPDLALWAAATGNEHIPEVLRSSSPDPLIADDSTGESTNTTTPESVSSHDTNTDDGDGVPYTPRTPELSTLPQGVSPATPSPGSFPAATVTVSDTPSKYTNSRSRGPFRPAHYDMSTTDDDESFDTAHEGIA